MLYAEKAVRERLFEMQDLKYRDFQCKLIPNVPPEAVIGVRTPALRALAKELAKTPEGQEFLSILPHGYYDENNLHGFMLETIKDYDACVEAVEAFLPYVDNWATCDLISPKAFKKEPERLLARIKRWIASEHTYTIRFGLEALMSHYLDERFEPEYLALAAGVRSEEYYVNMMIAWFFATALAKQYDAALPYIQERRLETWTHNKAIQKALESYRVSDGRKAYLRALKIR